jgi:hypothetical protein
MGENHCPKLGSDPANSASISQPDGTAADSPRGETQAHPNTSNRDYPRANPETSENQQGRINPSAPMDSTEGGHVTEHLVSEGPSTRDSSGEVGHPSGKGTLEINERTVSTGENPAGQKPGGTGKPADRDRGSAA